MKLSDKAIREIAGSIDCGFICYVNPETGEMEEFMENNEYEEDLLVTEIDDETPEWQKEEIAEIKARNERIDSWNYVIIRQPNSNESFRFMEDFVEEVIPEKEQKIYWKALSWKRPFANFKDLIDDSEYREAWFRFKEQKLMEYVKSELGMEE